MIELLEAKGTGCYVCNAYLGCVMYADDILLLSPSVAGLQTMLNTCHAYSVEYNILFNATKSNCIKVGKNWDINVLNMIIGAIDINCTTEFKYLGVSFLFGVKLQIDCLPVKRKFYAACNSVINKCKGAAESIKVLLVKSYCLPLLTYCIGALDLNSCLINQLGVCWNDIFRKIFGMNRWESVRLVQYFCDILPFKYLYDLHRWNFLSQAAYMCKPIVTLQSMTVYPDRFYWEYGYSGLSLSNNHRKNAVKHSFTNYCMELLS